MIYFIKYIRSSKYDLYRWQFYLEDYLKLIRVYLAKINTNSCLVNWISFVFLSLDAITYSFREKLNIFIKKSS